MFHGVGIGKYKRQCVLILRQELTEDQSLGFQNVIHDCHSIDVHSSNGNRQLRDNS